jgi:hypothetical protein
MTDGEGWWDVLRTVATSQPRTDGELLAVLDQLVVVATCTLTTRVSLR